LAFVRGSDRGLAVERAERGLARVRVERAVRVGAVAHSAAADPEHRQRLQRRDVNELAAEDRHLREPGEAGLRDVDALLLAPPLPGRGTAGVVGRRRAGRKDAAPVEWKLEEVEEPLDRDVLEPGGQGRSLP